MRQRWFTVFFIPVAPLEPADDASRFSKCDACKRSFPLPIETFARRAGAMTGNDHASAIELYNVLRDRPDDGATMLKLLTIYEAMDEPREADTSARAFPAAIASDPRCGEALQRIRGRQSS